MITEKLHPTRNYIMIPTVIRLQTLCSPKMPQSTKNDENNNFLLEVVIKIMALDLLLSFEKKKLAQAIVYNINITHQP